jgi:hypothetical protein
MEQFTFKRFNEGGLSTIGNLSLGSISIETPSVFPLLRTTQNPNDLEFLVNCKDQYDLGHVQGGVVRLYNLPKVVIPEMEKMKDNLKNSTLDNYKDPFTKFYDSNILMCDPALEYTYFTKTKYDEKFADNLYFCNRLVRFFREFAQRKYELRFSDDEKSVMKLRREMNDELWLGNSRSDRNERNKMAEQLTKYQLSYLRAATPISPLVISEEYLKVSLELNGLCQAVTWANERAVISYVPFLNSCIKKEEIITKYLDYVKKNKTTKLHAIKFRELDLHCPVDYKARHGFKGLMEKMLALEQENNKLAFMLLDAGTQYYVAMQVFDVIGTSLTGFDHDVDGGNKEKGEPTTIHWWDQHKMWSRPTSDSPLPEPSHCPYCNITPTFEFEDAILNRRRRGHRLFDLNNDASAYCEHVRAKDIGLHMRKRVGNAEFSYASDLILNP